MYRKNKLQITGDLIPLKFFKLYSFEVIVVKISALQLHKTRNLLMSKHGTPIIDHPAYQNEYLHWVSVHETVEIEGNEFQKSKTFTLLEFICPLN